MTWTVEEEAREDVGPALTTVVTSVVDHAAKHNYLPALCTAFLDRLACVARAADDVHVSDLSPAGQALSAALVNKAARALVEVLLTSVQGSLDPNATTNLLCLILRQLTPEAAEALPAPLRKDLVDAATSMAQEHPALRHRVTATLAPLAVC